MEIALPNGTKIGESLPPFIIAEVGSNFRDLDDCLKSVSLAKACGASAVKFQLYDHLALYGIPGAMPGTLNPEWLTKLKSKADAVGIHLMCSAFSPEQYEVVDRVVDIHKVASAEMTHLRILQKLRKLGKPVILSTGASGEADIRGALEVLGGVPVILMYCVAAYPARVIDLGIIQQMAQRFGVPVGYSDHSESATVIPQRAVELGACVLEKHVNFVGATGPDSPHSLDTDQFQYMVQVIRGVPSRGIGPSREEQGMVTRHNRRVLAITDIAVGQTLQEGVNFGIYRSLKADTVAAHPFMIGSMVGKPVKRAIAAGDGIGPGDV